MADYGSFEWPPGGSGNGVPIYPDFASFPAGSAIGDLAVAADTGILYEWRGASWVTLADPSSLPKTAAQEAPSGVVDGANVTYTLAHVPVPASLNLSQDGVTLRQGIGLDYTLSGSTITMAVAPSNLPIAQTLWAIYLY